MGINAFDHYTVRSADLQKAWRFYEDVLGLTVVARPGMQMPAAIVSIGDVQVVHVFQATAAQDAIFSRMQPADEETAYWRTGRLHHVGFWATDVPAFRERLQHHGVPFREHTLPDKYQFVFKDTDDIEIEVNFPLSEKPAGT